MNLGIPFMSPNFDSYLHSVNLLNGLSSISHSSSEAEKTQFLVFGMFVASISSDNKYSRSIIQRPLIQLVLDDSSREHYSAT